MTASAVVCADQERTHMQAALLMEYAHTHSPKVVTMTSTYVILTLAKLRIVASAACSNVR